MMAWHRPGDKPLSEPLIVYRRIYVSLGLSDLKETVWEYPIIVSSFLAFVRDDYLYTRVHTLSMMTSSNGKIIRVTGLLCEEFTGHRYPPETHLKSKSREICL